MAPLRAAFSARLVILAVAWTWATPGWSQPARATIPAAAPSPVTLELIMAHPDWMGRSPERPYWADDGASFYYFRSAPRRDGFDPSERELYQVDLEGRELRQVPPEARGGVDSPDGVFDRERRHKAWTHSGDVYLKDLATGSVRQITRNQEVERDPLFLTDGRLAFRRGDDVLARDLASGLEEELFDLRTVKDPIAAREEDLKKPDYLRDQQPRLLDAVRAMRARELYDLETARDRQRADPNRPDLPWYLGDDVEIRDLSPSPSGRWALVTLVPKKRDAGRRESMPRYVTESGYTEPREVRAKVGTGDPGSERLMLLDREGHQMVELEPTPLPGITDDPLAELRAAAKARLATAAAAGDDGGASGAKDAGERAKEPASGEDAKPKPRPLRFSHLLWTDDGARAVVQALSSDNKDRWIARVDLEARRLEPLYRDSDPAWIDRGFVDLGWLEDQRHLYLLSEESGFSQLYRLDPATAELLRLSRGDAVVDQVGESPDGRYLYYTTNVAHPGIYEVFRVAVEGAEPEQITHLGGTNDYRLSPDGGSLLITHSTTTRPDELFVQPASPTAAARQVTSTTSTEFLEIPWVAPQIVAVPSRHQARPITSRLYLPDSAPAEPGSRPAVVFAHGAGYLQNAHQGWSSYFREFMFHTFLAERGFVVLDMDYRASAGYGRDWRTAIYRQMGTPELQDLEDGVAYLVDAHGVDPQRVGIYGGSYGGFLALMALFTKPQLFAAGAALRPVTDWAHYNHPYTANILNTPDIDPEAYERSSPIEFAAGLEKPLLICSGMLDDNVFFQDSVRLVQRLIELEKQHWEIAIYPIEAHGFREPSSWLDEYRRIWTLFERHLESPAARAP